MPEPPAEPPTNPDTPRAQGAPRARRVRFPWYALPFVIVLGVALWYVYEYRDTGEVTAIRVTTRPAAINTNLEIVDKPDYYLRIATRSGGEHQLEAFDNTPIGNGLTWVLPNAIPLDDLHEISLWNHNMLRDEQIDRAEITGWEAAGQKYVFTAVGEVSPWYHFAIGIAAGAAVVVVAVALKFVYDLAV